MITRRLLTALSLVLAAAPAQAQTEPPALPRINATRLDPGARIMLDGRLAEDAWTLADVSSGFRQQDPQMGAPATEPTEIRILFDSRRIILGIRCLDSEPTRIFANQMQRDQSLAADDRLMISLDPQGDGRSGYFFEVNPAGAMGDGLVVQNNALASGPSVNRSWDGIWNARVARDEEGWSAEIEIPLQTISFDRQAAAWGLNVQRTIRRKNEETLWSAWARNQGLTYLFAAGRLVGLEGLSQGVGLDLLPYVVGSMTAAPGRGSPSNVFHGTAGGDLVYNLTPALRVNLSLNTDFAETEVDQRQVNLTRFPLFFPEKRAFFLDGAGLFEFSREPGTGITPFFSRRIGLDESGAPQPIDYGVKLTGRAGPFDLGILQTRTREGDRPAENFTVARPLWRFWRQSSIGAVATLRNGGTPGDPSRQTYGADFSLSTARFLGRQVLEYSGFLLQTTKLAGTSGGRAFGTRLTFPNDPLMAYIAYREVQDGYDPAVGFVDRRGYRLLNPDLRYIFHYDNRLVRRNSLEATLNFYYDMQGRLESQTGDLQLMRVQFQSEDQVDIHLRPQFERLPRDFTISRGVVLPAGGEYQFLRRRFNMTSATRRRVSFNASYEAGAFYSGTRRQLSGSIAFRPRRGWLVNMGAESNQVALAEGRFATRLWTNDVNTQLNPFTSIVSRLQFDSVSRQLGWQARFRWISKPGNDLFLVYAHNWREEDGLHTLDRKGSIKIVRTIRL